MKEDQKFRKRERITESRDFKRVMKLGKKVNSKNFILFMLQNEFPFSRLGVIVKKDIGKATYRNRIKRYFREFFRLNKYLFKDHFDLIFLVKKGCLINRYKELEEEIKRLGILI